MPGILPDRAHVLSRSYYVLCQSHSPALPTTLGEHYQDFNIESTRQGKSISLTEKTNQLSQLVNNKLHLSAFTGHGL